MPDYQSGGKLSSLDTATAIPAVSYLGFHFSKGYNPPCIKDYTFSAGTRAV